MDRACGIRLLAPWAVSIWIFLGIEGAVAISGRAKYSKDVGRATVTAFIGILCIYLLVSILSMGVMPRAELAELPNPSMAGVLEAVVGRGARRL